MAFSVSYLAALVLGVQLAHTYPGPVNWKPAEKRDTIAVGTTFPGFPNVGLPGVPNVGLPGLPSPGFPITPTAPTINLPGLPIPGVPNAPNVNLPGFPGFPTVPVGFPGVPGFPGVTVPFPGLPTVPLPNVPVPNLPPPGLPLPGLPVPPVAQPPSLPLPPPVGAPQPVPPVGASPPVPPVPNNPVPPVPNNPAPPLPNSPVPPAPNNPIPPAPNNPVPPAPGNPIPPVPPAPNTPVPPPSMPPPSVPPPPIPQPPVGHPPSVPPPSVPPPVGSPPVGSPPTSPPSSPNPPQSAPSPGSCGSFTSGTYQTSSSTYTIKCATDQPNGDLGPKSAQSFSGCFAICDATQGCVAFAYAGGNGPGTCYLKSQTGPTTSNPGIGYATTGQTSTYQPPAQQGSCAAIGANAFTSTAGSQYGVYCQSDFSGGDIGSKPSSTFQGCFAACDQTSGCLGFTYLPRTCYLKGAQGQASSNPNVNSAFKGSASSGNQQCNCPAATTVAVTAAPAAAT